MEKNKKIACVIPARLESKRFPHKILKNLAGKPLLQWAWDAANETGLFDSVVIAVDAEKTAKKVEEFGGKFLMTSVSCKTGTDRLIEVMLSKKFEADIWVNWQADEPFVTKTQILQLLSSCDKNDADVWTLKKRICKAGDICCSNVVKVVCDSIGYALYFSRSPIPFYREKDFAEKIYYKHIGLFAYTTEALEKISLFKESELEVAEKLEQLRFLHNKLKIKLIETCEEVVGIDSPKDLEEAEKFLKKRRKIEKNV